MILKLTACIFFYLFSWSSLHSQAQPSLPSGGNAITVSPTLTFNPNINTSLSSVTTLNVVHTFDFPKFSAPNMQPYIDYLTTKGSFAQSWIRSEKWLVIAATVASGYCAIYYQLHQINLMLSNPSSWCLWKEIVPSAHLAMTPAHTLQQEIELDLHKKYYSSINCKDVNAIHERFLKDTCKELALLEKYLTLYRFFNGAYLDKLLPFSHTPEIINKRKERLNFVIDLFISCHIQKQRSQQQ